jgi:hypothetical protein
MGEGKAAAMIDLYAPAAPGSLMRSLKVDQVGTFRLARRDCELYSVQIVSSGAWGRWRVSDGLGRELIEQPSTFTGSFVLNAGALGGLIVEVASRDIGANLTVNWREATDDIV